MPEIASCGLMDADFEMEAVMLVFAGLVVVASVAVMVLGVARAPQLRPVPVRRRRAR